MTHEEKAVKNFLAGYNCAQSVFLAFAEDLGLETDFAFAVRNGLDYRILLSGVTTREAALQRGVPAEKLCENLLEVTMA